MNAKEVAEDMKRFCGGGFATRQKIANYIGIKPDHVDRFLVGLERIDNKHYFIPDVVDNMMKRRGIR